MDIQQVRDVVELIANSQVAEVEIKSHHASIRVKNSGYTQPYSSQSIMSPSHFDLPNLGTRSGTELGTEPTIVPFSEAHRLSSPYIGRLKLAADAISQPLVSAGDSVQQGDVVAYVASMAQLLPVKSDKTGIIREILLPEDSKVEFGLAIMLIE